jgi:ABC-2 type transport system ATP-binding protein
VNSVTKIRIEGLRKTFADVRALDGLTLTVESGSVFGFLGPNGAGKTTTIRILTGLARATGGSAWVEEIEITANSANRRRVSSYIGYLPQDPTFYPWMTASELLDHVGRVFGLSSSERRARTQELLALTGLADAAKRRVGGFSGGMQQRLGIAQALVNRPRVLFLDEPISSLDPVGRKDVLQLIHQLRGRCTVFMSTHILADVERVCDTVGIINHGKLITEARQDELIQQYAVPAFEIEAENGYVEPLKAWAETLHQINWVTAVSTVGRTARVVVSDVETAKRALMASAVGSGLVLTRYEMVRPSLEDIFLKLVNQEEM